MTPKQRIALQADWWPAACRAQGWKVSDRDLRLLVCAWSVSLINPSQIELLEAIHSDRQPARWLASTNDLDNREDVDRVKACLGMLADNLKQTAEVGRPEIGRARRLRDVVRDQIKCLALFQERPRAYVAAIINDKFNHGQRLHPVTIRDLTADLVNNRPQSSQLDQLVMTLGRIVNQKRNENIFAPAWKHLERAEALTIHEMKIVAGAWCDCAQCQGRRTIPFRQPVEPENWADFDCELEPASCADSELGPDITVEAECPF